MEAFVAELASQAPYLAAIVIVVVLFLRSIEKRDDVFIKRDETWRQFLSEQREQNTSALTRLSNEISQNTASIVGLQEKQAAHDAWMRDAVEAMRKQTSRRGRGNGEQ